MSDKSSLLIERDGAVATLRLNRPDAGNALDVPLSRALLEAAIACDEDDSIRCVVLAASGRLFCAGGDISSFAAAGDALPALLKEITAYVHAAISRLAHMNKPLVTAINGPAAGAGFSLALLGDIAIAARSAHLSLAYSAIGLSPDGGATWLLPRLIGLRRAQEMALLNRRVTADEAATLGLITRAVDDAALVEEVREVSQRLAASATPALGKVRNLLAGSFSASLEAQMEAEAQGIAQLSRTDYGREGVAAFLAKRKPNFN
ncbi:MAG TPA: enoyl-CoA hydratase-related protein [Steroidobacter sp.]|jgi:2-(1,2-epoxy-1,2-dihydrophenyl)acetyl-CoA isomerase|nr:enoyl-CoA hydratase-related protein [Steroidobacteraceae bacterium]HLS82855.1 enoyl-CoA hydratase-related protein [Steroidobacter sp.]